MTDLPSITPHEALDLLRDGNRRFLSDAPYAPVMDRVHRLHLAAAQRPFAAYLSCSDSRVPPELLFERGLGELFIVRNAGNTLCATALGSLEFAVTQLQVPLIVVMGHEACGAVKATIDTPPGKSLGPNLDFLIKAIRPAVNAAAGAPEATRLRAAILENVADTLNDLVDQSAILREKFEGGEIGLVGGFYELSTGRVTFSEPIAAHGTTLR